MHEVSSIDNHSLGPANDPADMVRCCGVAVVVEVEERLSSPSCFSAILQYYWTL